MSDSVRLHRGQPSRLRHPWDSPGKNTGVGCHFLLQCMKVKSESEVARSCSTLGDPMDCSLPGSSVHWIFQARVLEWGAIAFSASVIREMEIKTTMKYHFILTMMVIIKDMCWQGFEETGISYTAVRIVKYCSHFGKQFDSSLKG